MVLTLGMRRYFFARCLKPLHKSSCHSSTKRCSNRQQRCACTCKTHTPMIDKQRSCLLGAPCNTTACCRPIRAITVVSEQSVDFPCDLVRQQKQVDYMRVPVGTRVYEWASQQSKREWRRQDDMRSCDHFRCWTWLARTRIAAHL
jgi:hypothetical protein